MVNCCLFVRCDLICLECFKAKHKEEAKSLQNEIERLNEKLRKKQERCVRAIVYIVNYDSCLLLKKCFVVSSEIELLYFLGLL